MIWWPSEKLHAEPCRMNHSSHRSMHLKLKWYRSAANATLKHRNCQTLNRFNCQTSVATRVRQCCCLLCIDGRRFVVKSHWAAPPITSSSNVFTQPNRKWDNRDEYLPRRNWNRRLWVWRRRRDVLLSVSVWRSLWNFQSKCPIADWTKNQIRRRCFVSETYSQTKTRNFRF